MKSRKYPKPENFTPSEEDLQRVGEEVSEFLSDDKIIVAGSKEIRGKRKTEPMSEQEKQEIEQQLKIQEMPEEELIRRLLYLAENSFFPSHTKINIYITDSEDGLWDLLVVELKQKKNSSPLSYPGIEHFYRLVKEEKLVSFAHELSFATLDWSENKKLKLIYPIKKF